MEQKYQEFIKTLLLNRELFQYWFGHHFENVDVTSLKEGDMVLVKTISRVMDARRHYTDKATYHNETYYLIGKFLCVENSELPLVLIEAFGKNSENEIISWKVRLQDNYSYIGENGEGTVLTSVGKFKFTDKDIQKVLKTAEKEAKLAEEKRIQAEQLADEQERLKQEFEEQERRNREEAKRIDEERLSKPKILTVGEYERLINTIGDLSQRLEEAESSINGLQNRIYNN